MAKSKKNTSWKVDILKLIEFLKYNKIWAVLLIILLLTVKWKIGWKDGFHFSLGCQPLTVHDVNVLIRGENE